jgi:hypothetical protein
MGDIVRVTDPIPLTTRARRLIRETLARGPRRADEMLALMADARIPRWAVQHAKKRERIVIRRKGFGQGQACFWMLPASPPPPPAPDPVKQLFEPFDPRLPSYEDGYREARRELREMQLADLQARRLAEEQTCRWSGCGSGKQKGHGFCQRHTRLMHVYAQHAYLHKKRLKRWKAQDRARAQSHGRLGDRYRYRGTYRVGPATTRRAGGPTISRFVVLELLMHLRDASSMLTALPKPEGWEAMPVRTYLGQTLSMIRETIRYARDNMPQPQRPARHRRKAAQLMAPDHTRSTSIDARFGEGHDAASAPMAEGSEGQSPRDPPRRAADPGSAGAADRIGEEAAGTRARAGESCTPVPHPGRKRD